MYRTDDRFTLALVGLCPSTEWQDTASHVDNKTPTPEKTGWHEKW
jgi:hypothetical protein